MGRSSVHGSVHCGPQGGVAEAPIARSELPDGRSVDKLWRGAHSPGIRVLEERHLQAFRCVPNTRIVTIRVFKAT